MKFTINASVQKWSKIFGNQALGAKLRAYTNYILYNVFVTLYRILDCSMNLYRKVQ